MAYTKCNYFFGCRTYRVSSLRRENGEHSTRGTSGAGPTVVYQWKGQSAVLNACFWFDARISKPFALTTKPSTGPFFGQTINDHARPTGDGNGSHGYLSADPSRFRVASVVPVEFERWRRRCPAISPISSADALDGVYPTLGVDRALAVRGAARVR